MKLSRLTLAAVGVAWLAAAGMVLGMLIAFALIFPYQAKLKQEAARKEASAAEIEQRQQDAQIAFQMATVGVTVSVGLLGLAALMTIVLVFASRRATLRQINANLLVISEQLKELQRTAAKP